MKEIKSSKASTFERYWGIIKNGLFLFGLRNRLAGIGLDFGPYYWVLEDAEPCEIPKIKGDDSNFTLRYLNLEEMMQVAHVKSGREYEKLVDGMKRGQLCIALEDHSEIAAYMFIELNDFDVGGRTFEIKSNEAYLLNMWTFHGYRGRNLAPYLRYKSYRLLDERGRTDKYSITDYFNKSSIKFKNKLKAKHLYLYLNIILFRKFKWNFTLKKLD